MKLVTAEEMRALDRSTIASGRVTGFALMQRAGESVAEAMERRFGPLLGMRVLVLCGAGNNGGDGFVAAQALSQRGAEVHAALLGDRTRLPADARAHLERFESAGHVLSSTTDLPALEKLVASRDAWDFAVDALLGTGARGEPEAAIADGVEVLRQLDERGTRVVAVDLPTGVDADHGDISRRAVRADLTVTFGAAKRGHWLYPGRAFAGVVEVVDIGLDPSPSTIEISSEAEMAALVPRRDPRAHKSSVGRLVLVGGSPGLTGAVTLAAKAATRSGAGYVTVCVPKSFETIFDIQLIEEISVGMRETPQHTLAAEAFQDIVGRAKDARAVTLGSGMSTDSSTAELCRRLVFETPWPMVLDADALNAFAGRAEMLGRAPGPRIVTPHLGEMSRLTGLTAAELERERIDVARTYAKKWNVVVVLKGAPTVVADPDGRTTVNTSGNPGLATAGTGDVLTGVIAALVAQGLPPYDAARLGAYVHGRAGDLAVEQRGELGLAASDLLETLPRALDRLARAEHTSQHRSGT